MADSKRTRKPGIAPKAGPKTAKVKRIRPLSPGEFRDLLQGLQSERTYGQKVMLWFGAKLISAGLICYRLAD